MLQSTNTTLPLAGTKNTAVRGNRLSRFKPEKRSSNTPGLLLSDDHFAPKVVNQLVAVAAAPPLGTQKFRSSPKVTLPRFVT